MCEVITLGATGFIMLVMLLAVFAALDRMCDGGDDGSFA